MGFILRHKVISSAVGAVAAVIVIVAIGTAVSSPASNTADGPSTTASAPTATGPRATSSRGPAAASTKSAGARSGTAISSPEPTTALAGATTARLVDNSAGADAALSLLGTLAVKGRAPMTDYARTMFGPAWTDDVSGVEGGHNGCDTRNDILRRDLDQASIGRNGCTVLAGVLHDPYTGTTVAFSATDPDAVQIDHVVSLGDAWATGIQYRSVLDRVRLANDPLNLQATTAAANTRKSDGDAATWLPPNRSYRCAYVARQIEVKARYRLWVTAAEHDAMVRVLEGCGGTAASSARVSTATTGTTSRGLASQAPATSAAAVHAAPNSVAPTSAAPPPTTTAAVVTPQPQGCHPLSNAGNCYRPGQFCRATDHGDIGIDSYGERIQCRDNNGWRWEKI